jgi:hypothetical protein
MVTIANLGRDVTGRPFLDELSKSTGTTLRCGAQSGDGFVVRSASSSLSETKMCAKSQQLRLIMRMVRLGAAASTSQSMSIFGSAFASVSALCRKGMAQSLLLERHR